jgi:hypothetical protein
VVQDAMRRDPGPRTRPLTVGLTALHCLALDCINARTATAATKTPHRACRILVVVPTPVGGVLF